MFEVLLGAAIVVLGLEYLTPRPRRLSHIIPVSPREMHDELPIKNACINCITELQMDDKFCRLAPNKQECVGTIYNVAYKLTEEEARCEIHTKNTSN